MDGLRDTINKASTRVICVSKSIRFSSHIFSKEWCFTVVNGEISQSTKGIDFFTILLKEL